MFKKHFLTILRWGLRLHGVGHLIEVFSAVMEGAYITACIAMTFITIEILASFYIQDQETIFLQLYVALLRLLRLLIPHHQES